MILFMKDSIQNIWKILSEATKRWLDFDPWAHGAAVAYYAIFSLPGLLIIIIWSAGVIFGEEAVHGQLSNQIQQYLGEQSAESIEQLIANARVSEDKTLMKVLGIVTLLFGATTLFLQLQKILNKIWGVKAAPKNGLIKLLSDRATSLGIIVAISFLLLISLSLSAMISLMSTWIEVYFGETWLVLIRALNLMLSFAVTTLLFAIMFRALPDVEIAWRTVWVGAITTAALFSIGKTLLGIYFGYSDPGSSFGAAGTIILVMLWVNYTSLILFYGATISKVDARLSGHKIKPSSHAKWINEG